MATGLPIIFRAGLWTPSQIFTALWLDATDSSTITLNGSTVSQWSDKSGNGRNATQATAANQPGWGVGRNLLLWSDEFQQAYWVKARVTITPNVEVSPIGDLTADKLIPTSAVGAHVLYNSPQVETTAGVSTWTVRAKAGEYNFITICGISVARHSVTFDLTTGAVTKTASSGSPTNTSNAARHIGGGWWELSLSMTASAGTVTSLTIAASSTGTPNQDASLNVTDIGDNFSGIFIWGAQINPGAAADQYQKTTSSAYTISTGLNGKPAITFSSASSDWMSTGTLHGAMQNDYTVLSVLFTDNTVTNAQWYSCPGFLGGEAGGIGADHGIGFNGLFPITGIGNPDTLYQATNSVISNAPSLLSWGRVSSTGVLNWFKDGAANGQATGAAGARTFTSSLALGSMLQGGTSQYLTFTVGEIVVTSYALPAADRQKLEGYLAWKWGIQNNLPANHPYKNTPPTV